MKFLKESQFKDELKDLDSEINFYKGKIQALNDYADKNGFDDILPSGRTVEKEIQYYSTKQASAIDKKAELEKPRKKVVKNLFQDKFEEDLNELLGIKNKKDFKTIKENRVEEIKKKYLESSNQLKDMARHNKKRQKGKGWFVKLNAGNPEYNASFFNRAMGNDTTSSSDISSGEGTGLAEDLNKEVNSVEENIEPGQINIRQSLIELDKEDPDFLGALSSMYDYLEPDLTIKDKKELIDLINKQDYLKIFNFLNGKIDVEFDYEIHEEEID